MEEERRGKNTVGASVILSVGDGASLNRSGSSRNEQEQRRRASLRIVRHSGQLNRGTRKEEEKWMMSRF